MVTITKIGEEYNSQILEISGLSTDPKPVDQIDGVFIANGSTFKEIDTGKEYTYNESAETWHINKSASSGGTGSGVNGKDGITPNIGENGNWFIGTVDTEVPAQGPAGENGVTPHIGTNGNWYIGSTDTGVSAKGVKGDNGLDGNGIKSAILNSDYTLTLTFDNGTTYTTPSIRGATGDAGSAGKNGTDGKDGSDGVGIASIKQTTTSTADGGNNVFTVTLTNGTIATFTVKNGSKGSTGKDGSNGVDGGHYTPVVTQPTTDTMQISFAPSKSDMPVVDPVTVNLPVSENSGQNVKHLEPADDDIPRMFFTLDGWLPTTKDEGKAKCILRYVSKTADFSRPVTMGVQGASSASMPHYKKKNYTMVPYKDNTYEDKDKLTFRDWPAMNKFVLKASWVTPSHIRNPGTAEIAGQVVRSRSDYSNLPEELRNSPNQGATHGFPVRVWVNGIYWGIYELIVAKDKLFGQDKGNALHSIVGTEFNDRPSCAFATTLPTIYGNWSEELQDEMSADTKTSLENFIKFVAGSTDAEFTANAEVYFDVQSVIDADIVFRLFCVPDNLCRNQIFYKYDKLWYEGFWDLDAVLGLPPVAGQIWYAYDTPFQEGYVAYRDHGVINMLYKRIEECFMDRFKARYWELRANVLSITNVLNVYERRMDTLKSYDGLLAEDYASTTGNGQFTGMPNTDKDNIQQIRQFVHDRWAYMDEVITAMVPPVRCIGITLDQNSISFNGAGTQTLTATVTPDDCNEAVVWKSDNTGIATVADGVVTAVADGSTNITVSCGEYSATCAVSVSGLAELTTNILRDVPWQAACLMTDGALKESTVDIASGNIDISAYQGTTILVYCDVVSPSSQRMLFYDEEGARLTTIAIGQSTTTEPVTVPANAKYARMGILARNTTVEIRVPVLEDAGYASAETVASSEYNSSGEIVASSGSIRYVPVNPGESYLATSMWSIVAVDGTKTYISGSYIGSSVHNRCIYKEVPDGAAYLGASTNIGGANVERIVSYDAVGSASDIVPETV